jgi:hypothetical protein
VTRSAHQLRADARALVLRAQELAANRGARSALDVRGGRRGLRGGDPAAVANANSPSP